MLVLQHGTLLYIMYYALTCDTVLHCCARNIYSYFVIWTANATELSDNILIISQWTWKAICCVKVIEISLAAF